MKFCRFFPLFVFFLFVVLISCDSDPDDEVVEFLVDENGLWTDKGLVFPIESQPVHVNEDWIEGVKKHTRPIRSLVADETFEDLRFLDPILSNKKIVQLGESGHGVKQFNQSKVRLIKYLHQKLGFDVIAFESSLFECYYTYNTDFPDPHGLPQTHMASTIFGVWQTHEVLELFNYIKESFNTSNPLILAGFDVQSSSRTGRKRAGFFKDIIGRIDTEYADQAFEYVNKFHLKLASANSEEYYENSEEHILEFEELVQFLELNMTELIQLYADSPNHLHPIIAYQSAKNIIAYYLTLGANVKDEYQASFETRDVGMAESLIYLAEKVYPDKKIIAWAHNAHIRHNHPVVTGYLDGYKNMGMYLHDHFGDDIYTVGLFMYTGTATWNDRTRYTIEPAKYGSLESIIHRTEWKAGFIDFKSIPNDHETSWIFEPSYNKAWGTIDMKMIPNDQYNGILFVQETSNPRYVY